MKLSSYDYALTLLSYNPKTIAMMKKTLLAKWYTLTDVEYTLNKLIEQEYLDDYAFCKAYFTSEVIHKGKSIQNIKQKMYEKGMPSDIVKEVLAELDEEIQESGVGNLAREIQKLNKQGYDIIKIYEKLARKGHRYDDIKQALEYINNKNQGHEE